MTSVINLLGNNIDSVFNEYTPSAYDARDYKYTPLNTSTLPTSVDLRPLNRDMEDQSIQGSCITNGITNADEILAERKGVYQNLSRQFLYYTMREMEGRLGQEGGYCIRDCLEAYRKYGNCLENEWPYDASKRDVKPPQEVYDKAATRKLIRYEFVDISNSMVLGTDPDAGIRNIKAALAEGLPVIVGIALGEHVFNISGPLSTHRYGLVDIPNMRPVTGNTYVGGHCWIIVGYDDALGGFIVENSWGSGWGDNGYLLLPYICIKDMSEAAIIRTTNEYDYTDLIKYDLQEKIVAAYVAVLDRAPDLAGFNWWLGEMLNNTRTLDEMINEFMTSQESRTRFDNNGKIVCDIIYQLAKYKNKCEVARYFVVDLACSNNELCKAAIENVTDDVGSIDVAKKYIRMRLGNGVI